MYRSQPTGGVLKEKTVQRIKENVGIVPAEVSIPLSKGEPSMAAWWDAALHVGMWIAVIVVEFMVFFKCDDWNKTPLDAAVSTTVMQDTATHPYAIAALITTLVSATVIFGILLVHWATRYTRETDSVWLALVMGSLRSSFVFTIVMVLFVPSATKSASDSFRTQSIFLIIGKTFLISILNHNTRRDAIEKGTDEMGMLAGATP